MRGTSARRESKAPTNLKPLHKPIYMTHPLLPDREEVNDKFGEIWARGPTFSPRPEIPVNSIDAAVPPKYHHARFVWRVARSPFGRRLS